MLQSFQTSIRSLVRSGRSFGFQKNWLSKTESSRSKVLADKLGWPLESTKKMMWDAFDAEERGLHHLSQNTHTLSSISMDDADRRLTALHATMFFEGADLCALVSAGLNSQERVRKLVHVIDTYRSIQCKTHPFDVFLTIFPTMTYASCMLITENPITTLLAISGFSYEIYVISKILQRSSVSSEFSSQLAERLETLRRQCEDPKSDRTTIVSVSTSVKDIRHRPRVSTEGR